ncbi:MAG TPA: hypothetical protein VIS56_01780 [Candidatus Saccharimonadales bacterium]
MEETSPFKLAKDISAHVARLVSGLDIDSLPLNVRETVMTLKAQATDIRLDVRDYGMAETREDQQRLAKEAVERLESIQATILKASEYNLLSAADVAQLSAQLQQLITVL